MRKAGFLGREDTRGRISQNDVLRSGVLCCGDYGTVGEQGVLTMAIHHGIVLMCGVVPCSHDEQIAQYREDQDFARDQLEHLRVVRRLDPFNLVQEEAQYGEDTERRRKPIRVIQLLFRQRLLGLRFVLEVDRLLGDALLRSDGPDRCERTVGVRLCFR